MDYSQSAHPYALASTASSAPGGPGPPTSSQQHDAPPPRSAPATAPTPSGSVNRKLVIDPIHGHTREETREERRQRKELERQARPQPGTPGAAPSASSTTTANPSTSSKSVLTIALQRAQSAVLLDSANNFPAAISAYSQSVRLLKEVMARVETKSTHTATAPEMDRTANASSSSTITRRDSESQQEWDKRKARWDKKEKAKADEARRLRVIHDTYEDRIKMLLAMNPALASATLPPTPSTSTSTAPLPSSTSANSNLGQTSNPSSPTSASMRFHRRRSSTELDLAPASPTVTTSQHRSKPSLSSMTTSSRPTSPSLIGQAMLASASGLTSPLTPTDSSPSSPSAPLNGVPRINQLPVISPSNSFKNLDSASFQSQDPSYLSYRTGERPLSTSSDSTARAFPPSGTATPTLSTAPSTAHLPPPPPPPPPNHPPPPIPTAEQHPYNLNTVETKSSSDEDPIVPPTALDYGQDWPGPAVAAPNPPRSMSLSSQGGYSAGRPELPIASLATTSSMPMRRGYSASAVFDANPNATITSGRIPTSTSATAAPMGPGGSMAMRRTMSSQETSSGFVRPPLRTVSLVSQPGPDVTTAAIAAAGAEMSGLVNDSTLGGTISQRRFGPTLVERPTQPLEAQIIVRAPSQDSHRSGSFSQGTVDEFGTNTVRAGNSGGGGGFGNLPGRLRALSQPNQKRPKLPSNPSGSWAPEYPNSSSSSASSSPATATSSPPVPPLLSQSSTQSSVNSRHHLPALSISSTQSNSRKPSAPTPTSLNAPPFPSSLGRSNSSSSSIGSASTSGGRFSERASIPQPPLPSSATQSSRPRPSSRADSVMSIPPVRRPFHLMRLVLATMPNSNSVSPTASRVSLASASNPNGNSIATGSGAGGGYLSEKLYVPSQIWTIPGSKLVALETKVRMMEIVINSLISIARTGSTVLDRSTSSHHPHLQHAHEARDSVLRFEKELEGFEHVMEEVQNTLSKKLANGLIQPFGSGIGNDNFHSTNGGGGGASLSTVSSLSTQGGLGERNEFGAIGPGKDSSEFGARVGGSVKEGRKGSTAGSQFASWSSKFQRGLDRVTNANGVSLDSQTTYVDTIARLFKHSQCIDQHLVVLLAATAATSSDSSAYALLTLSDKHRVERQLRRASEFFGTVICRFVLKDIGLLLDKYVKRGGAWLSGE
ncbi:uncharacterized protein JCM15063_005381 [Sporobolomyces koalae]|uniref:uncharacterized protein n=1 Tax=Sporobolomyces koalae TaxID=500713 RepID=UPI003179873C